MTDGAGEMSFLDHLEELRRRIMWVVAAVAVGVVIGLWAVDRLDLVGVLMHPIAPYLPSGKLVATGVTDPVVVVLKLGLIVGLVLASPVILWQVWAFVAPALYDREKGVLIPALFVGLVLFLTGATLSFLFVVPAALRVLLGIQSNNFSSFITADNYFSFVLQIVLALGLACELPLVIIILSSFGVVDAAGLRKFRRFAIVLAAAAGAILSPGTDVLSMGMMTMPIIVLYEIGVIGASVVGRRRRRREATTTTTLVILVALCLGASQAQAQVPVQDHADSVPPGADSLRPTGQPLDSNKARRMGLPTGPTRNFGASDSVTEALLKRTDYQSTRYRADSAILYVPEQRMNLVGNALTERQGSQLEADTIGYNQASCLLNAVGDPKLFDHGQVLVGQRIHFNSCTRRGVVDDALTNFNNGGVVWFLRGNVSQDSSAKRIYAASSDITSCDLPTPHYHFSAREMKWISNNVMVARPVVLYIADVPILWLPFIFQDMRSGRRSGILVPQFGLNDLVRPNRSYSRHVTNVGYYWAGSQYFDATARLDWYSERYLNYGVSTEYRWLNRFVNGALAWNNQRQIGGTGGSSMGFQWRHQQQFDLSTSLSADVNYASSTSIIAANAIDPRVNTQDITSQIRFTKRLGWGSIDIGGSRAQSISSGRVTQTLPSFSINPIPVALGSNVTWSPTLSFTNNTSSKVPASPLLQVGVGGVLDTIPQLSSSRSTAFSLTTPFRFGSFTWDNSVQVSDEFFDGRDSVGFRNPNDSSVTVSQIFTSRFQTGVDWNTGINLPPLFRGSWKLFPSVGIANATSGPFAIRNRNTDGDFVIQGKRFRFGLTSNPTLFAFLPGIGPVTKIRHSFTPSIAYSYSPAASVSESFARAIANPGETIKLRSDPTQTISVGLSQVFEGKLRPPPGDTVGATARKLRLLSVNTSPISYDFEQAKLPGRTGWVSSTVGNSLLSDLVPGFSLSMSHSLWRGDPGSDTSHFDPFLQSVSASFSLSGRTLCVLGVIIGLCPRTSTTLARNQNAPIPGYIAGGGANRWPGTFGNSGQLGMGGQNRAFSSSFNYTLSRSRPRPVTATSPAIASSTTQNLGFSTSFSPTPFWALSWTSQYDITNSKFADQQVVLSRDLHDWRAEFRFYRNPNGNVAFYFSVSLTDLPELHFNYDQQTIERP